MLKYWSITQEAYLTAKEKSWWKATPDEGLMDKWVSVWGAGAEYGQHWANNSNWIAKKAFYSNVQNMQHYICHCCASQILNNYCVSKMFHIIINISQVKCDTLWSDHHMPRHTSPTSKRYSSEKKRYNAVTFIWQECCVGEP